MAPFRTRGGTGGIFVGVTLCSSKKGMPIDLDLDDDDDDDHDDHSQRHHVAMPAAAADGAVTPRARIAFYWLLVTGWIRSIWSRCFMSLISVLDSRFKIWVQFFIFDFWRREFSENGFRFVGIVGVQSTDNLITYWCLILIPTSDSYS